MNQRHPLRHLALLTQLLDAHAPQPEPTLYAPHPYGFLLAVLLSARCFDSRVNQVIPTLLELADSPEGMVGLEIEEIRQVIRPCGLSRQKAKAIWLLSEQLIRFHNGTVPATRSALEALPGVGRKTASVVLSQCFGVSAFPVDTHVFRCARRWQLSSARSRERVERDLMAFFPEKLWVKTHLQMIAVGRKICRSRGHDGVACPFCRHFS
ncbi:endonuclease III domain-containing protein [Candidatus Similichlamydia laticola]|nr:endonuclease III [Candidatus Similichlamydia laticola]